jgi:hypothetical protein
LELLVGNIQYLPCPYSWLYIQAIALNNTGINPKQRHFPVIIVYCFLSQPLADTDELFNPIYQEIWGSYWRYQCLIRSMQNKGGFLITSSVIRLILPELCIRRFCKKYQYYFPMALWILQKVTKILRCTTFHATPSNL